MTITERAYKALLASPQAPPEIGGLLGSHNGIIDSIYFDRSKSSQVLDQAIYVPDIEALNAQLSRWAGNTDFSGIFHSHLPTSSGLSESDKQYIQVIMQSMSERQCSLYFPVVLPGKLLVFRATRSNDNVYITEETLHVIKERNHYETEK